MVNMKEAVKQSAAEIKKELKKSIDYRTLNSLLPLNSVSILVDEILAVGDISEELQTRIGKTLGKRWLRRR